MPKLTVTRAFDAPLAKLWSSWDDFGAIDRFNPNLSRSFLINGSSETGLGAERQCDFADGKNHVRERIIEYVPQRRIKIDIYDGTVPLRSAVATFEFRARGAAASEATMTMEFVPKFGPLGRLMAPLMKIRLRKGLTALLDANKAFVERGVELRGAA